MQKPSGGCAGAVVAGPMMVHVAPVQKIVLNYGISWKSPRPHPGERHISVLTPVAPQPFSCCAKINAQKENATPAFCFLPFRHRPQGFKDLHMCFT